MGLFVLLIGFPGVGKLTIAKELDALIGAKIVDNHWFNNPILRLFDDEGLSSLPSDIWQYTGQVRQSVLSAICSYSSRFDNFIFTHAGSEGDKRSIRTYSQFVEAASRCEATFVPVRLLCNEEELVRRVSLPARKQHLKSTDPEASRYRSKTSTVLKIPHANALTLDVTINSPVQSALAIRDHISRVAHSFDDSP
ncbi:chloramphenicol phosphotransferase [Ochrobactrum sp. Marseille-Q0166]|uniref:chloramphenicol phosphotransferase n=1 Tax=Ochrobactrum sp. Marseille-Q0166 TaxID=2761105 RepID=UPI001655E67B|nr:chloramphenicol phosphotransferase [Ochrobactrum sp. Marseille-Q0166]MBC8717718.1 chloramphenicol phosphotransferase [Ochrobactrum sp. Marseille-Q0166]